MEQPTTVVSSSSKNYTVDDIMELGSKLKIGKKKNAEPQITKAISKNKKNKPKKHAKKSQKIVKF